ncbi:MAG: hypothetical protein IPK79_09205 [Vampirovibrionales bacterium]|nr:hypothetical protein [Vampirovibrionales bacterium]
MTKTISQSLRITRRVYRQALTLALMLACLLISVSRAQPEQDDTLPGVGETLSGVVLHAQRIPPAQLRSERPDLAAALGPSEYLETARVRIVRGALAGETVSVERLVNAQAPPLSPGARVTLEYEIQPNQPARILLSDYERAPALFLLAGVLLILLILTGGSASLWLLGGAGALALLTREHMLSALETPGDEWRALLIAILALFAILAGVARLCGMGSPRARFLYSLGGITAILSGTAVLAAVMAWAPLSGAMTESMMNWPPAKTGALYLLAGLFWSAALVAPLSACHWRRIQQQEADISWLQALRLGRSPLASTLGATFLIAMALVTPLTLVWGQTPQSALLNQEDVVGWISWILTAMIAACVSLPVTAWAALRAKAHQRSQEPHGQATPQTAA